MLLRKIGGINWKGIDEGTKENLPQKMQSEDSATLGDNTYSARISDK